MPSSSLSAAMDASRYRPDRTVARLAAPAAVGPALAAAALALMMCGCGTGLLGPAGDGDPGPVLELAGQSRARRVTPQTIPFTHFPADGRPGDLLLENELVQFVVAGAGHGSLVPLRGNLIDAGLQGGRDGLRLLVPILGTEPRLQPVYTSVVVQREGGLDEEAVVVASGHLATRPDVSVTTTYRLPPARQSLEVVTRVENGGDGMLPLLELCDRLYHGRTLRYEPAAGFMPRGRGGPSTYVAFFEGSWGWGVLRRLGSILATHRAGHSDLHYATVDVPPGGVRTYRRLFAAAAGGSAGVWELLARVPKEARSRLQVVVREAATGRPVADARILLRPADGRAPCLLMTNASGRAAVSVREGHYAVQPRAPGRPEIEPLRASCVAGRSHRLRVPVPAASTARVQVRARAGRFTSPAAGRVRALPAGRSGIPPPPPSPYPGQFASAWAFVDGSEEGAVALVPGGFRLAGRHVLTATKGPLYDLAAKRVLAEPGQTVRFGPLLRRVVDAGDYIGIDMRQHTQASIDSPLTLEERALSSACEGLAAAVVSDPLLRRGLDLAPEGAVQVIPGLRVELNGRGSFSVYPVGEAGAPPAELRPLLSADPPVDKVLAGLRGLFPDALIQVNDPLDPDTGYFALTAPAAGEAAELPFDAVELLSGGHRQRATDAMRRWFALLNRGQRPIAVAGSGSRDLVNPPAGIARTFVRCRPVTGTPRPSDVVEALRRLRDRPDAFVTNGPFVEATLDGAPIGGTVRPEGSVVRLWVRVQAPRWVDVTRVAVYRNGREEATIDVEGAERVVRCDRTLELEAAGDCWFAVLVEGQRPMALVYPGGADAPTPFALTNPFWVDADRDGEVRIQP